MKAFSIPDEKGNIIQLNDGTNNGNVFATYNVDFDINKLRLSQQMKVTLSEADNVALSGYAAAIVPYSDDGQTGRIFAVSDNAFSTSFSTPTGSWTEETAGAQPAVANTVTDGCVFNGLFLVSDTTDIAAWNGTTWIDNYWTSTLSQSALVSGERHILKVGSDGNLYVVDGGNKVYKVDPSTGATVSGNGTLDLSSLPIQITCMEKTSTRMWIGTRALNGGFGSVIEWDLSPDSATYNKIHYVGEESVLAIGVNDDTPYAVLSDGTIKYFDGSRFKTYDGYQFPVKPGHRLHQDFIHPNGWDIIDDKIHFLVNGRTTAQEVTTSENEAYYAMPAGVWCLDPKRGLYNRFNLGRNTGTQYDYGKAIITAVGALCAIRSQGSNSTKFLASYEYRHNASTSYAVIAHHEVVPTSDVRGHLITPFVFSGRTPLKSSDCFFKPMGTGAKVKVYTRTEEKEESQLIGYWYDTYTFNTASINTGIVKGNMAFIKSGNGSGQWMRVDSVQESAATTSIRFETANTFVAQNDYGMIDVFDFQYMGTIDSTTKDYETLSVPSSNNKRQRQFLYELIQPEGTEIEIDYIQVNP